MKLNRNAIGITNKVSRLLKLKIVTSVALLACSQFVQATPIDIQVNDNNGQPLSHAVVEVIKQDVSLDLPAVNAAPVVMDQVNKQFLPDLILIQQGQSIVFPNSDNIRHHVYSFSKAKTFELKLYAGKPEKPIAFETNGVVIVGCNIHDSMVGSIYVAKNSAMITAENGKVTLDFDPAIDKISIWHPLQKNSPEERRIVDMKTAQRSDDKASYIISIDINKPAARDTFRDTY